MTVNPQNIGVFSELFAISGCDTHFIWVNFAETIKDRPGQPAHQMLGIKRRFQRCEVRPPKFKESSVEVHQIWVPPSKRAVSATVIQSSKRTVADRHRLPWTRAALQSTRAQPQLPAARANYSAERQKLHYYNVV